MASTSAVTRVIEAVGPHRLVGAVVAGFKRGSKQLGWPTANLDPKVFEHRFDDSTEGVYVGWAAINDPTLPAESRAVHKAVLSIGWNVRTASLFHRRPLFYSHRFSIHQTPLFSSHAQPHFDDLKERTIEAYLCHDFGGRDFYDAEMRLLICAFLRPQAKFETFEALVEAITTDVEFGKSALDAPALAALATDELFAVEPAAEPAAETQPP